MLVNIPDELIEELKRTSKLVKRYSNDSAKDAYWGAVGELEIATIEIMDVIHKEIK